MTYDLPLPATATAGDLLLAALAEYGITTHSDWIGMSYAIPLDPGTPEQRIRDSAHLSVGDRGPSIEHDPGEHTGWTVFLHDEHGMPLGDPLYIAGDGGLVDCTEESAVTAAVIADFLTAPDRHGKRGTARATGTCARCCSEPCRPATVRPRRRNTRTPSRYSSPKELQPCCPAAPALLPCSRPRSMLRTPRTTAHACRGGPPCPRQAPHTTVGPPP